MNPVRNLNRVTEIMEIKLYKLKLKQKIFLSFLTG